MSAIENTVNNKCEAVANVTQEIKGIEILLEGVNCGNIRFEQNAKAQTTCEFDGAAAALAQASMAASSEQVLGLGIGANVDTSLQERTSTIKQKLKNECGSTAKIAQTLRDNKITIRPYTVPGSGGLFRKPDVIAASCEDIEFIQNADASAQCVAKVVMDAIEKSEQTKTSSQKVDALSGLLGGLLLPILLPIGILVILAIVFAVVRSMKSSSKGGTGAPPAGVPGAAPPASKATGANMASAVSSFLPALMGAASGKKTGKTPLLTGKNPLLGGGKNGNKTVPIIVLVVLGLVMWSKLKDSAVKAEGYTGYKPAQDYKQHRYQQLVDHQGLSQRSHVAEAFHSGGGDLECEDEGAGYHAYLKAPDYKLHRYQQSADHRGMAVAERFRGCDPNSELMNEPTGVAAYRPEDVWAEHEFQSTKW